MNIEEVRKWFDVSHTAIAPLSCTVTIGDQLKSTAKGFHVIWCLSLFNVATITCFVGEPLLCHIYYIM